MQKQLRLQILLLMLLVGTFVVLVNSPVVYSQLGPCNIITLAPTGPPTVGAGQTLQVTTTVIGSCDQSMFYAVRVDLADGRTSQVLDSVVFPYAPVTAAFTVSINNQATAPTTLGPWVLQVNGYLIAAMNGGVVASAHVLFNVVVVPYTPSTTTTTEQMITTSTTSPSPIFATTTTSQMTSINETPFTTSTSSAAALENTQLGTFAALAAIVAVIAAVVVILMLSRRKRSTTQKPQPLQSASARYCENCGTKLEATDDEFCSQCGSKVNS